jgi:hypothetical protein
MLGSAFCRIVEIVVAEVLRDAGRMPINSISSTGTIPAEHTLESVATTLTHLFLSYMSTSNAVAADFTKAAQKGSISTVFLTGLVMFVSTCFIYSHSRNSTFESFTGARYTNAQVVPAGPVVPAGLAQHHRGNESGDTEAYDE